ncbi:MAG: tetratricopeptide repeat protein [Treponema sp.]
MSKPLKRCKIIIVFSGLIMLFSCASAPKSGGKKVSTVYSDSSDSETQTAIPSGKRRKMKQYFSNIDENIIAEVENGSPSSLRRAASSLRKSELEYTESEKILLAIASGIMQIVWSTERIDWEAPKLEGTTSYTGAINSAQEGIYDTSTGNFDFLSIVLPSLAVITCSDVSGFFLQSQEALRNALSMRQDSVLAAYLLGMLYKKNKMYEEALPYLKSAYSNAPDCFQTGFESADCMRLAGHIKESNAAAAALLEKYPSNLSLLKLCAETAFTLKNLSAAEDYIARLLQQDPSDLDSVLFRARILIGRQDYIHAMPLLDVYSRQDNSSKDYLLLRAQIQYDWSKNTGAAIATIENALKNYPGDKDIMLFAAKLSGESGFSVAGKYSDEYADEVLKSDPNNESALQFALNGFIRKQVWEKAYTLSSAMLKNQTLSNTALFSHIRVCLALKKYDEALNLISPLYRTQSSDEEVVQCYITVMSETGRETQALNLINQLLPSASTRMKSFLYYRKSLLQNTESAALADLRSSLISNPRNSDALFRLYEIYYKKSDLRKAQYYLKQVIALNPNDAKMRTLNEQLEAQIK